MISSFCKCRSSKGHARSLLWKNFLIWRRTPCISAIEVLSPIILCIVLVYMRTTIDYDIIPSVELKEVVYDETGDIGYSAVYHYPFIEEPRLDLTYEEKWIESENAFAGVVPRTRLFFIPRSCFWTGNYATQRQIIGLAPRNKYTESIAFQIRKWVIMWKREYGYLLDLSWKYFDSKEEMFEYVEHPSYMKDFENRKGLCFGISHNEIESEDGFTEHTFEFHFDDLDNSRYKNIPSQLSAAYDQYSGEPNLPSYYLYVRQGFNLFQNICANAILRSKLLNLDAQIISLIKPMQTNEFVKDDFYYAQVAILPIIMVVIFLLPIYRMISLLVNERAMKTKDMVRSMGIGEDSYWLSWFLYYLIGLTLVTFLQAVLLTYGVFKFSELIPVFLVLWLYGLSLFGYIAFIQSFFSKPTLASIVGSLIFFVSSFVDQIVKDPLQDEHWKLLASMIPSVAVQRCFIALSEFEKQRQGLTWATIQTEVHNYRVDNAFVMFVFFFVCFTALGIYLSQVLPHAAGGFREHPCFCCGAQNYKNTSPSRLQRRIKNQRETDLEDGATVDNKNFEKINKSKYEKQMHSGNVLRFQNLTKYYGSQVKAVDNLSMEMFGGEIFALLGHNGAGKTTTIKTVIGQLEATNGRMVFQKKDLAKNRKNLHHKIGICPQENILYNTLTVMEHFELFAAFRAPKQPQAQNVDTKAQIDKLIQDLDLSDYRNVMAKNLSGGNKRKLQVGLAFVGDSCNLILLDEPTAGLDIAARRRMWDMLQAYKQDRVIILTTHYMDEAEILGDRVGIMSRGKLVCQGSTAFLKNRFGTGSRIILELTKKDAFQQLMETYRRDSTQEVRVKEMDGQAQQIVQKFQIILPNAKTQKEIAPILKLLDDKRESLGISNTEISQTTLEQVFIKVASNQLKEKMNKIKANSGDYLEAEERESIKKLKQQISDELVNNRKNQFCKHAALVIKKRANIYRRSLKTLMLEIFIPLLLLLTGFSMSKIQFLFQSQPRELSPSLYGDDIERILVNRDVVNPPSDAQLEERDPYILARPATLSDQQKEDFFKTDQNIWANHKHTTSMFCRTCWFDRDTFSMRSKLGDEHLTSEQFVAALPQSRTAFKAKYLEYSTLEDDVGYQGRDLWKQMEKDVYNMQFNDDLMDEEADLKGFGAYYLYEMNNSTKQFKVGTLVNTTQQDVAPLYPQYMYESIIKLATGDPKLKFTLINSPLPIPKEMQEQEKAASSIFLVFVITISYALMQASTIAFVCHEKERNLKHMQFIQGMSRTAYWLVNFLFDLFKSLMVSAMIVLLIEVFDLDFPDSWTLLVEFPFAIVPFTYASSFLFTKESTAQNCTIFIHMILGSIAASSVFVMRLIRQTEEQGDQLNDIMKVFPSYALSSGMLYSSSKKLMNETREYTAAEVYNATSSRNTISLEAMQEAIANMPPRANITLDSFDMANMGGDIVALGAHCVFGLLLVILIEYSHVILKRKCCRGIRVGNSQNAVGIVNENKEQGESSRKNLIQVDNLHKAYDRRGSCCVSKQKEQSQKTKDALIKTSFNVKEHECFSLLGENGAGKSTCFKILTNEENLTSGQVQLLGLDVLNNKSSVAKEMGYCPQDDVLFDLLSVEEHLYFYATLRCLENKKKHIDALIETLRLSSERSKLSKNLSGGNKRKLSVGIALVGKPRLILLDEPSTGVDPDARQHMWQTIGAFQQIGKKSSAILLTTHSMEEAETLSSRLAIMTKGGKMACQGSTSQIKNDHGKNFHLELTLSSSEASNLQQIDAASIELYNLRDSELLGISKEPESSRQLMDISFRDEIKQKAAWTQQEVIQILEANLMTHLAIQIKTSGILCPQALEKEGSLISSNDLWNWLYLHCQLLSCIYKLLEDERIAEIQVSKDEEDEKPNTFQLVLEKTSGDKQQDGEAQVLTRVDLIVKLGQFNSVENFQVNETSLEQIFQEFIKTDEEKAKSLKSKTLSSLRFINNSAQIIQPEIFGEDGVETGTEREILSLPKIKTNEKAYKPVSYIMVQERENQQAIKTVQTSGSGVNKIGF